MSARTNRLTTSPDTAAASDARPTVHVQFDPPAGELDRLRNENRALRAALGSAGVPVPDIDGAGRSHPSRPSFGLSAGERSDLETNGVTTDAYSGGMLIAGVGVAADVEPQTPAARANAAAARRSATLFADRAASSTTPVAPAGEE